MPVCPLCENAQDAGDSCDVCGNPFSGGGSGGAEVPPLEALEPTLFEAAEVAGEALPDLEPTAFSPGPAEPVAPVEIDPTRTAAVDVRVEAMADLEPTFEAPVPDDGPAEDAAGPVCRYCRTPAPPTDTFCHRCGMRLPSGAPRPASEAAAGAPCRSCGTPTTGEACRACGARTAR